MEKNICCKKICGILSFVTFYFASDLLYLDLCNDRLNLFSNELISELYKGLITIVTGVRSAHFHMKSVNFRFLDFFCLFVLPLQESQWQ